MPAVGCPLPVPPKVAAQPDLQRPGLGDPPKNCRECHRPGRVGPFSLVTYEQARKRAGDIAEVVEGRRMPPWKPSPGIGPKFLHDKSLSQEDIDTVIAWAESGAREESGRNPIRPRPKSSSGPSVNPTSFCKPMRNMKSPRPAMTSTAALF